MENNYKKDKKFSTGFLNANEKDALGLTTTEI